MDRAGSEFAFQIFIVTCSGRRYTLSFGRCSSRGRFPVFEPWAWLREIFSLRFVVVGAVEQLHVVAKLISGQITSKQV